MTLKKENERVVRSAGRLWAVWSILLVVAAALLRLLFLQGLGTNAPYITFYPAVAIAALYGGLRAGFLTLALSAAVAIYFWIEPMHTLTSRNPFDWLLLGTFLATTALISIVAEAMHRARARAHAAIEREVAALAQREADGRLRFALEQSQTGGWDLDLVDHTALRTLKHDQIFGYESLLPEWTYERFLEHVLPEDRAEVDRRFRAATATQGNWSFECRIRRQDGAVRWIWATGDHQRDASGQARRMAGIVKDITERKQAETALRESERRYRSLVEVFPDAIFINRENQIVFINAAGLKLLGATDPAQVLGRSPLNFFHPDCHPLIQERIRGLLEKKQSTLLVEDRLLRLDGAVVSVETTAVTFEDQGVTSIQVVVRDITDRMRAEQALHEREAQLREAQRIGQMGSWQLDLVANRLAWSDEIFRIFEIDPQQFGASYEAFLEAVHPDDREMINRAYAESVRSRTPYEIAHRLQMPDGRIKFVQERCETVYDTSGKPLRSLGTVQDITERKQAEVELARHREHLEQLVSQRTQDLEAARAAALSLVQDAQRSERRVAEALAAQRALAAQLEETNQELASFSYSVSHDLRSPLRGIDGFSQVLEEDYADKLDDTGRSHLARVRAAAQRMSGLIDDLLKLSKITRAELHRQPVDLSGLARTIAAELHQREPRRQVAWAIADGLAAEGDPQLLRVALENLLGNAWKFCGRRPDARIEFGITANGSARAFFVRDNGAGFDMAHANKLFGAFQRLHTLAEFEGTGIGLATVQRIVHRHGGRVWAEGAVNGGATFYFTL